MQQVITFWFVSLFWLVGMSIPSNAQANSHLELAHQASSHAKLQRKSRTKRKAKKRFRKIARVKHFSVVDPATGKAVAGFKKIKKDSVIELSALNSDTVFLRIVSRPKKVGSYRVVISRTTGEERVTTETQVLPGSVESYLELAKTGEYTIKATPFYGETGRGPKGRSKSLSFRIKKGKDSGGESGSGKKPKPTATPSHSPTPEPTNSPTPTPEPSASPSPTPSSTPTPEPQELRRVNVGGASYTDSNGRVWAADSGLPVSGSYSAFSIVKPISNTIDDTLYHSEAWGDYTYAFPDGNGHYQVELHFAEIYFQNAGERVFDVSAEGNLKLDNLDLAGEAGPDTATARTIDVHVTDGVLNISLSPSANHAKLSGLVVTRVSGEGNSTPTPSPSPSPSPSASPSGSPTPPPGPGMISAVWANDGGDKVTREELRVSGSSPQNVNNSVWDGSQVDLFAAKNEVVAFNLVLEAANGNTSPVSVSFNQLVGPGGYTIGSVPTAGNGVFNYVGRNIELFFVRYLQIKGLSKLFYEHYDERHIPKRFQRPYVGEGLGTGTWYDRPDHDKYYPDIAVPLEIEGNFTIASGNNQSVWVDVYVPKSAPAGFYSGTVQISEGGQVTQQVPVSLEVKNFTLPDTPSSQTMLYLGYTNVNKRYLGVNYPTGAAANASTTIRDRHFQMAHRHKIQIIDNDNGATVWNLDQPRPEWIPRLNGDLFTTANGYDGPGVGTGNGVYSIGTYSTWGWKGEGEASMRTHTDAWVNWFDANAPNTEHFLYLIDESSNYTQTNTWAEWINNNPGVGHRLMSFATAKVPHATQHMPELDIAAGWMASGITNEWENAVNTLSANPDKRVYMYNGKRPASGSFAIEDDGVALRELPWGQYKKKIDRWFFWESTYYNNYQGGQGETNVFQEAQTFGGYSGPNSLIGETGWNYSNGDGVLFYPGTDVLFPSDSYGVMGPMASLRLKHWRRGVQDIDYVTMAAQINPAATQAIVQQMVPEVMWEPGISDPHDPTWVRTDISWSIDPNDWETAREQLAAIILGE